MNKFSKEDQIWAIVWMIFAVVFGFMLGFGVNAAALASSLSKEEVSTVKCLYLDPSIISESSLILEEPVENNPTLVVERLCGSDLYCFYIAQICEQYYPEVDPYIALAVLETESNYQPNVMSSAGAVGLMQWIPRYHSWRMEKFHLNNVWDPYTNIIVGMDLLNDLFQSTGSWDQALYGYNHSIYYVNSVLKTADLLRGGGCFG